MGATTIADAAPDDLIDWHAINWRKVNRKVRRLQVRIVKALQAGNRRKVSALQRILARSFSGGALAVKRVTENPGKRTAGVDKEIWDTPASKAKAIDRIRTGQYKAKPLRPILIPKGKGHRRLLIPAMVDRARQALHLLTLDPIAETQADPKSYGFRRERSAADAIQMGFYFLCRRYAPQWILKCDIKSCFDMISHQWLLTHIPMDKKVLAQWLKAGYVDRRSFYQIRRGAAQGAIISPCLMNMTLDGLEPLLKAHFSQHKVAMIRFADDICVTGVSKELLVNKVKPLIEGFLAKRGLSLSAEKTQVVSIDEGFDFLGTNFRKYDGKLLTKPSKKSVKAILRKVRKIISKNKQAKTCNLINMLNPVIQGWARYHQHTVSKEIFSKIDNQIWIRLWGWAKRRHPEKKRPWILKKYFMPEKDNGKQWAFAGETEEGEIRYLARMQTYPIIRHTKIRGDANPYDPKDEPYFEQRQAKQWLKGYNRSGKLRRLWLRQKGQCPECGSKITLETGWNIHHVIYRVHGGSDNLDNLVLLHPNCHRKLHVRDSK